MDDDAFEEAVGREVRRDLEQAYLRETAIKWEASEASSI